MKITYHLITLFALSLLTGCKLIGQIFQAGYYAGIFVVLSILVLIAGLYYYLKRRS